MPVEMIKSAAATSSTSLRKARPLFTAQMLVPSMVQALKMLDPRFMVRNPVMFIAELGALLTTLVTISATFSRDESVGYFLHVSVWLWLTVWFANFAEAVAEARGRAQAVSLRKRARTSWRIASSTPTRCKSPTCQPPNCATATSCASKPMKPSQPTAK